MSAPVHCPFCGDEDLRPAEDSAAAWSCRSCARVFTVSFLRVDQAAIPGHVAAAAAAGSAGAATQAGPAATGGAR